MNKQEYLVRLQEAVPSIESLTCDPWEDACYVGLRGPLKFHDLDAVSSILNTERIDIDSDIVTLGCDTCGHGAEAEIVLTCYGVKVDE